MKHQSTALVKKEGPAPPGWPLAKAMLLHTHLHTGLVLEKQLQGRCCIFLWGWGVRKEKFSKAIEREKRGGKKSLKEEAGCGYRKAYFFKNTSGSYVTLNFSAAAL